MASSQGKLDEAREYCERTLAIREKALGPDHSLVADSLNNLANAAARQGKLDDARDLYGRALAIYEKSRGPIHPGVAHALGNLGIVAEMQGRHEEAREFYERTVVVWEQALGPDHPHVANPLTGLGMVLLALYRPADALAPLERALSIRTTRQVDPVALAQTCFALARALWTAPVAQGRDRTRARTLAEQARDAYTALGEGTKTELAEVQAWLAEHRLP